MQKDWHLLREPLASASFFLLMMACSAVVGEEDASTVQGVSYDLRRTRLSGEPESFGSWLCRGWRLPWCGGAAVDNSGMLRILALRRQVNSGLCFCSCKN